MHNSCAASDRRRLFSNLWYHIKNDSLCNRRFMDCMWCGFIDPELDIKKDTVKTLIVGKELKALAYMAMLLIYSILFKRSFLISTILLGVATLAMTGTKKKLYYVIVIAMVVVLYLLFAKVLHIQLP